MNKKENQRFMDTQNKIDGVFMALLRKKTVREISVSEICRLSGIHRTTFYGHYTDVYDLMEKMMGRAYEQIMGGFMADDQFSLRSGFLETFRLVQDNKEFFRYYLENMQGGMENGIFRIPEKLAANSDRLIKDMGYSGREELLYHQAFFNGGLTAILRMWIDSGCRESPEEMCDMIDKEYQPRREYFDREHSAAQN